MNIDTESMVSVSDIRDHGISTYVTRVAEGETIAIVKNNKVAAVLTGCSTYGHIQALDEREENLRLWTAALTRYATDDGSRYSLEEVAAEYGIDLDAIDDED